MKYCMLVGTRLSEEDIFGEDFPFLLCAGTHVLCSTCTFPETKLVPNYL